MSAVEFLHQVNDMARIRLLLARGADANARSSEEGNSCTVLLVLCRQQSSELQVFAAGLLIDAGAGVNDMSGGPGGFTALQIAAKNHNSRLVEFLLSRGADPVQRYGFGLGGIALHVACLPQVLLTAPGGAPAAVREVLAMLVRAAPESLKYLNQNTQTPLHLAATSGSSAAAAALLALGADASAQDRYGNTPFLDCIGGQHLHALEVLLPASNLLQKSHTGRHALHACVASDWDAGFKLMLPYYADDVDAPSIRGAYPAGQKVGDVDLGGVECLAGYTAAWIAASAGQLSKLRALLKAGASRTASIEDGTTLLHAAASGGHLSCLCCLLGKPGAYLMSTEEVDTRDARGLTALHSAASAGETECAGVLVAAGADASCGGEEASPLRYAQAYHPGNTALLRFLESAVAAGPGRDLPMPIPGSSCGFCLKAASPTHKLKSCSSCMAIRYCSQGCAASNWKAHKKVCKAKRAELEKLRAERIWILGERNVQT